MGDKIGYFVMLINGEGLGSGYLRVFFRWGYIYVSDVFKGIF